MFHSNIYGCDSFKICATAVEWICFLFVGPCLFDLLVHFRSSLARQLNCTIVSSSHLAWKMRSLGLNELIEKLHEHLTPHHNYSVLLPSTTHQRSWQANNWSCMISSSFPPLPCSSRSATGSAVSEPNMETSFLPRWCEETEARHNQPALSGKQSDRSSTTAKKKHQLQRHFKMCWVSSME